MTETEWKGTPYLIPHPETKAGLEIEWDRLSEQVRGIASKMIEIEDKLQALKKEEGGEDEP